MIKFLLKLFHILFSKRASTGHETQIKQEAPQKSSKALSAMHPKLREAYDDLCLLYRSEYPGFTFKLIEVYRSPQKQKELYEQGRTKPGKIITYVDGYKKKGKHNCYPSKAFDIMVYNERIKKGTWNMKYYKRLPKLAALTSIRLGFKILNGGDWVKLKDYPHFEIF